MGVRAIKFDHAILVDIYNVNHDQVRYLINRLNKRVYGNAYSRYGKSLKHVVIYHHPTSKYQFYIDTPTDRLTPDELVDLVHEARSKTDIDKIDVNIMHDIHVMDLSTLMSEYEVIEQSG